MKNPDVNAMKGVMVGLFIVLPFWALFFLVMRVVAS